MTWYLSVQYTYIDLPKKQYADTHKRKTIYEDRFNIYCFVQVMEKLEKVLYIYHSKM